MVLLEEKETQVAQQTKATEEELVEQFQEKLKAALAKVPPEVLAEAKKRADELGKAINFEEMVAQLNLEQYTPEKMIQIAEVGYNEFKIGRYDRAAKIFRGLIVLDSENYYYHQMLGATYQRQEKLGDAIIEYGLAVQCNPKDTVSLTNRGECFFKSKVFDRAGRDFDAAIALDTQGEDKWANRAKMLKKRIEMIQK